MNTTNEQDSDLPSGITPAIIEEIVNCFDTINEKQVRTMIAEFRRFFLDPTPYPEGDLSRQYLSHLLRSMECILRKNCDNPLFRIIVEPLPPDDKQRELATANYVKNRCFSVYYHPQIEIKELRILLAHELGHLFLTAIAEKETADKTTEPLCSIFGIIAILERDHFYTNRCKSIVHQFPIEVVAQFKKMENRGQGKHNIS